MAEPKTISLFTAAVIAGGMTVLSAGISYLMRPKPKLGENKPNEYATNIIDTDAYVPIAYGKCVVPILVVFVDTNPENINELHWVGVLCMGEIEEVDAVYFDNMEIVAKRDGDHWEYHENYLPPMIHFERRKGTTADATTKRRYETITKLFKKWTKNHLSAGVASIYMLMNYDQEKLNSIPDVYCKVRGQKVYDPRDETTKYSNNPVLCLLHYLTDTVHGKGLDIDTQIVISSFIAEANYCDEQIEYEKVDSPDKVTNIHLVEKEKEYPFTAGTTYYFKTSWARGTEIDSEDDSYTYHNSALSAASTGVVATSAYGRFKISDIPVPSEGDNISIKTLYMSDASGGTYYRVDNVDTEDTKAQAYAYNTSVPYAASGTPPTTPPTAPTVTFENWGSSALDEGKYYKYKFTFKTTEGDETAPSPATKKIKTKTNQNVIKLKLPETDDDNVTHVIVYRTVGYSDPAEHKTNSDFFEVTEIAIATNYYYDTVGDGSLGSGNPPSSTTTVYSYIDRFNCNGLLDTGNDQDDNIEKLLSSCRGKIYNEGGKYGIFIPKITVPETFELTEENIIGDWTFTIRGVSDRVNISKASFINPNKEWKSDTVVWPRRDAQNYYLKDDNNFKKVMDLDLPFTTNKKIAKTICQVARKETRNNIAVEITAKESARILKVGNLVKVTHSIPEWTDKLFWVVGVGLFPNATVRLSLLEYTEDDYNYEVLDEDTLPGADTDLGDPTDVPDEVTLDSDAFEEVSYVNKKITYWKLKVSFNEPSSNFWKRSDVYVKVSGGDYELYTTINKESNGVFYVDPIQEATNYYFKILSVSTLNAKLELDDVEVTEWTYETGGVLGNPPDVTGFGAVVNGSTVSLKWDKIDTIAVSDFDHYEIRHSTGTGSPVWDECDPVGSFTGTTTNFLNVPAGTHKYWIKAFDTKENPSDNAVGTEALDVDDGASWTELLTDTFDFVMSDDIHDGTESSTGGTYGLRLQVGQSALTNPNFESALGTEWSVGTGWSRVSGGYSGSWSLKVAWAAVFGDRTTQNVTTPTITAGKTYIFKAWVKSNVAGVARIAVDLDGTITYSAPHPGDGIWRLMSVTRTCGTPTGTPKVILYVGSLSVGQYAQFDHCGFTRFTGTYTIGEAYDNGVTVTKKYKLSHRIAQITSVLYPPGAILIDLGVSDDDSTYTWLPGLEAGEVIGVGRYAKFRVRFINVWVDEVLYLRTIDGSYLRFYQADLVESDTGQTIETDQIVYGQGTSTFGQSEYFAWET